MHITKLYRRLRSLEEHKMLKPLFSQAVDKLGRAIDYRFQFTTSNPDISTTDQPGLGSSMEPSSVKSLDTKISPREFKNVKQQQLRTKFAS